MDLPMCRIERPRVLDGIAAVLGREPLDEISLTPLLTELPLPLFITRGERDGRFVFANHAGAALFELPREVLLDRSAVEFYADPAERPRLYERLRRDGSGFDTEMRFRTATGRLFWAAVSVRALVVGGQELCVAAINDIDERRRAEEQVAALLCRIEQQNAELEHRVAERTAELAAARDAAARSQRQLVDAIEAISDGFALWDAEDRFVLCNTKYRNEHSLVPDWLVPGAPHRLVLDEGVRRGLFPQGYSPAGWIAERLDRHREPGPPYIVRTRDGRSVRMAEYRTREGGTVAIRTDITELVRHADALDESRRLLQGVIDAVPAPISVKARDLRYVLVNRAHTDIYGPAEETLGRTSADVSGALHGARAHRLDCQVFECGEALPIAEYSFPDRSGRSRMWLAAKMPLMDPTGEVTNVVTVALDITQFKETERARANLSRYFAPNLVELLATSDEPFGPPRCQEIAVLFVDIVGFTRLCSEAPPDQIFALLREFLQRMAACVFECEGTLDKYTGDGMMATFGTPEPGERDATRALRCAHAMRRATAVWNEVRRAAGLTQVAIAIGLQYGSALLGNLGSERRLDFGVVGDTANVANRLEKLARPIGAELVVGEALVERARQESGDAAPELAGLYRLGPKRLRGRAEPVTVWVAP